MKFESANLNRNIIQLQTNSHQLNIGTHNHNSNFMNGPSSNIRQPQNNYDRLPNHVENNNILYSNRPSHPITNPHIVTNRLQSKSGVNPVARASLNHSTICNFIELPNGGFLRSSEVGSSRKLPTSSPVGHEYYPHHQQQLQQFQPIHNRSPI